MSAKSYVKVELQKLVDKMDLENLTPKIDISETYLTMPDINRPGLQLAGFFDYFEVTRMQVIGNVEYHYLATLSLEERKKAYTRLMDYRIPGIILSRGLNAEQPLLQIANRKKVPVFSSNMATSVLTSEIIRWLAVVLAPSISIHGVLVDVMGEGVLITGESGMGKSEAALELVKRGHRLVSDDVVEIRRLGDDSLSGNAPEITKHFIELRGIGIVNVKSMFGASAVKDQQEINLSIHLEEWDKDKTYDRIGLQETYAEYLGIKIPSHTIPVRPGRNIAVICETAAVNHRQKKMGYNAAKELYARVEQSMAGTMPGGL